MSGRPVALAVAVVVAACTGAKAPPAPEVVCPDEACRQRAQARLDGLRRELTPGQPRGYQVEVELREGRTGRAFSARGAYAVAPPDGLRMQLVGPAGATALDLWVRGPRARLALPALDRVEREPEAFGPGRPTGFLRWWLLRPLDGDVLAAGEDGEATWWRLRASDGAELRVRALRQGLRVERLTEGEREQVEATGLGCGEAVYRSEAARLEVRVRCEKAAGEPSPRAFDEPGG